MQLLKVKIFAVSVCSLSMLLLVPSMASANNLNSQTSDQVAAATDCELQNQAVSESDTKLTAELAAATNTEPQNYTELRERQTDSNMAQSQPCQCPNPSGSNTGGARPSTTRPANTGVRPAPPVSVPALW